MATEQTDLRTVGGYRFCFWVLEGWQDGVTGFDRATFAPTGVITAAYSWSLGLGDSEIATVRSDVACLPSGWLDLNAIS